MNQLRISAACVAGLLLLPSLAAAQERLLPPGDETPILRLNPAGPLAHVSDVAMSPDGRTLYAAGWDKVVHVWHLQDDRFVYDRKNTLRVPVGPGNYGGLNCVAVSPDGRWVATAGRGTARDMAGVRQSGWRWPVTAQSERMRKDQGLIYVFDTQTDSCKLLQGHRGPVMSLSFVPKSARFPDKSPTLLSAADEANSEGQRGGTVRVWDVAGGRQLEVLTKFPAKDRKEWQFIPSPTESIAFPRLTGWHTGPAPNDLRVGIAWGDDAFRVWEVRSGRVVHGPTARLPAVAAVLSQTRQTVLSGASGELGVWSIPAQPFGQLGRHLRRSAEFSSWPSVAENEIPVDAVVLNSRSRDGDDRVAVLAWRIPRTFRQTKRVDYVLSLFDPATGRLVAQHELWRGPTELADLAAVPGGDFLAVSEHPDHGVRVYRIDEVLRPDVRLQPQVLRPRQPTPRRVAFARKGEALGILASERSGSGDSGRAGPREEGDFVFDLSRSALHRDTSGWRVAGPESGEWSVRREPAAEAESDSGGARAVLSVFRGGKRVARIAVSTDSRSPLRRALCPPGEHCSVPLLAVAGRRGGEPFLRIYNGRTGDRVRELVGHAGPVTSLAFSEDGRLLVTAAEDRTVRVWKLSDLEETTLGRRGFIPGLRLSAADDGLLVQDGGDSGLREGDIVVEAGAPDRLRAFADPKDFYRFLLRKQPGETVRLRVARNGRELPEPLVLTVGQAIDERKPLFSLFWIPPEAQGESWEWIAWRPLGPYDVSSREAENSLGWHFNTGEPERPVRFATAGEYRDQYYRPALLPELVAHGELRETPLPDPQISLRVRKKNLAPGAGPLTPPDYEGRLFVQTGELEALVQLHDGFPDGKVDTVQWRLDDGPLREAQQVSEGEWLADLSRIEWERGMHRLRVRLRTAEQRPRQATDEVRLRYQPPPVAIVGRQPSRVKQPDFQLTAAVRDLADTVDVTLVHKHRGTTLTQRQWTIEQPLEIDETLQLKPGLNEIQIEARNRHALPNYEDFETAFRNWHIRFEKPQLPTITLDRLRPVGPDAERLDPVPVQPDDGVATVPVPKVRVEGRITAPVPLEEAELNDSSLAGFQARQDKEYEIAEEVELQPGRQTLVFRARTESGGLEEVRLPVEYQPPLPEIGGLTLERLPGEKAYPPSASLPDSVIYAGYHQARVKVHGRLDPQLSRQPPFQARVLIDGRTLEEVPVDIDEERHRFRAEVPVEPGKQRIAVRLTDEWGGERTSRPLPVDFRRPPTIVEANVPDRTRSAFLEFACTVRSPEGLPLQDVEVRVNGNRVSEVTTARMDEADDLWQVRVAKLPLQCREEAATVNEIEVRAWNADGHVVRPAVYEVEVAPSKGRPAPPRIVLEQPGRDVSVSRQELVVEFQVHSEVRPERVLVSVNDRPIEVAVQEPGTVYRQPVPLEKGPNTIRVRAVSPGGGTSEVVERTVSLTPEPVRIVVDRLGALRPPAGRQGLDLDSVSRVAQGEVSLAGRVLLTDTGGLRLAERRIQIWVNGFLQAHQQLAETEKPRQLGFSADLILNKPERNRINIVLPGLPEDASVSPQEFVLACDEPQRNQHLHLLVVGPAVRRDRGEQLVSRALTALQTRAGADSSRWRRQLQQIVDEDRVIRTQRFTAVDGRLPPFAKITVYGPVTHGGAGHTVDSSDIELWLRHLRRKVQQNRMEGPPENDLVVFYYEGREFQRTEPRGRSGPSGEFVIAGFDNWHDPGAVSESAVTSGDLGEIFDSTLGAHLVFLDVSSPAQVAKKQWPHDRYPYLGVFRKVRLNEEGPDEPPQLMAALETSLPRIERFGELEAQLRRVFPRLFDAHVPEPLRDVAFVSSANRPGG